MLHFRTTNIAPWQINLKICSISTARLGSSCPPPLPKGMVWPFWQREPPIPKADPEEPVHMWVTEVRGRGSLRLLSSIANVVMSSFPSQGTKKPAPAPPRQASPFASQPSGTHPPSSSHHPPVTPRRNPSKEALIQSPSYPPPQPPQAHQGEPEPSPPSTPTPPDTPPHDGSSTNPMSSYNSGSLPRPSRPAPRPRPRPSLPPPPQPVANDNSNDNCGSASKIITGKRNNMMTSHNMMILRQSRLSKIKACLRKYRKCVFATFKL